MSGRGLEGRCLKGAGLGGGDEVGFIDNEHDRERESCVSQLLQLI